MNRIYIYTLLSFLVGLTFVVGCSSERDRNFSLNTNICLCSLDKEVSIHPRKVLVSADSLMALYPDSFTYYRLLNLKAQAKLFLSEFDSMKLYLDETRVYCEQHTDIDGVDALLGNVHNAYGNYFSRLSLMDSANYHFKLAYVQTKRAKRMTELPDIAINIADSYVRSGQFDLGSFWYWKSLALGDSLEFTEDKRFPSYFGLAQVHMELGDFAACDSFYSKADKFYEEMKPYEKHVYLNNRGNSYYYRQDYPTALSYFRRSYALVQQWPHMEFERYLTKINLGEVFLLLNQLDSAQYYLDGCQEFFQKQNNASALYYIDTQLIELAIKQGNIPLARQRIRDAVTTAQVEPNMKHIRNQCLQHYYEESGDFKQAYFYQKQNNHIDDSIRSVRVKMRNSELTLKYRVDHSLMQKEILIRQQENKMLRMSQWIYILLFGTVAAAALFWAFFQYTVHQKDKKVWKLHNEMNSLRLDNMRNRISPHFLFNVLNHEMDRFKDESDKTNLLALTHLLRRHLELADQICISLADELDFVRSFLQLEKQSLGDGFIFVLEVDDEIDLKTVYIPGMSIYCMVENAVKHSLMMKEGKRCLSIKIHSNGNRFEIRICDNGGGFKTSSVSMGTGTGMRIVTQTIQLFNQYNRNPVYMKIHNVPLEDGETGCEISYSIPKDYKFVIKN